jgi:hypothetical protein
MKIDDHNKIYFKLWRFLEFEVTGSDAIHAGKPYMYFGAVFIALFLIVLYSAQSSGFGRLISLLAR